MITVYFLVFLLCNAWYFTLEHAIVDCVLKVLLLISPDGALYAVMNGEDYEGIDVPLEGVDQQTGNLPNYITNLAHFNPAASAFLSKVVPVPGFRKCG